MMTCEFIVNSVHGNGGCQNQDGNLYKLCSDDVSRLSARPFLMIVTDEKRVSADELTDLFSHATRLAFHEGPFFPEPFGPR